MLVSLIWYGHRSKAETIGKKLKERKKHGVSNTVKLDFDNADAECTAYIAEFVEETKNFILNCNPELVLI